MTKAVLDNYAEINAILAMLRVDTGPPHPQKKTINILEKVSNVEPPLHCIRRRVASWIPVEVCPLLSEDWVSRLRALRGRVQPRIQVAVIRLAAQNYWTDY